MAHGTMKGSICLLFLTTTATLLIANSARILDEVDPEEPQVIGNLPLPGAGAGNPSATTGTASVITTPQVGPANTLPSAQTAPVIPIPQVGPATSGNQEADAEVKPPVPVPDTEVEPPVPVPVPVPVPDTEVEPPVPVPVPVPDTEVEPPVSVPVPVPVPDTEVEPPVPVPVPVPDPVPVQAPVTAPADEVSPVVGAANGVAVSKEPSISFFMHDIIGGSHPSARVVAGIVANTDVTGLPFSQANNNLFPITGGIPLVNPKLNGIITNNNLPLLVGLSGGQASTVFQNPATGNIVSGANNQPFVSAGNLPAGFTLQKLMFGSITVIDDELTEGHELGSSVVGRAQGFYMASSLDGTSQSVVLTVLLHGGEHNHDEMEDSISLFGVHRTASPHSEVAVIGGTGKYENARGYAVLETLLKEDQHTTDGVDTILHFDVYLTH